MKPADAITNKKKGFSIVGPSDVLFLGLGCGAFYYGLPKPVPMTMPPMTPMFLALAALVASSHDSSRVENSLANILRRRGAFALR